MNEQIDTSIYWDINQIKSYQRMVNMITGPRGAGKTFGWKIDAMDTIVLDKAGELTGNMFLYVRRTEAEFERTNKKFFNDMYERYPDHEFKISADEYLMDGNTIGYNMALSTALGMKGAPMPQVKTIGFDEFLIDPSAPYQRYLNDEPYLLMHLYETVVRPMKGKPLVPLWMLANTYTMFNQYFDAWDVKAPRNKKKIWTSNERSLLLQFVDVEGFEEAKMDNEFGDFIKGTTYQKTSVQAEFIRDTEEFVRPVPSKMTHMFNMKVAGNWFGVYVAISDGIMFVRSKKESNSKIQYTLIFDDHEPNILLLKGGGESELFKRFRKAYKMGVVYYENVRTQSAVKEVMRHCL